MSRYFEMRRGSISGDISTQLRSEYPKATFIVDCENHLILACNVCRGPGNDCTQFKPTLNSLPKSVELQTLLADRGYDSESNHVVAREELKIRTVIPPRDSRLQRGAPKGKYRREMFYRFKKRVRDFAQRWQIESALSMMKRALGEALPGRKHTAHCRDIALKAIVHNLKIVAAI